MRAITTKTDLVEYLIDSCGSEAPTADMDSVIDVLKSRGLKFDGREYVGLAESLDMSADEWLALMWPCDN